MEVYSRKSGLSNLLPKSVYPISSNFYVGVSSVQIGSEAKDGLFIVAATLEYFTS
jgi:hypothetical protein